MNIIILLLAIAYIALVFHGTAIAELIIAASLGLAIASVAICICETKKTGAYPDAFTPKAFFDNAMKLSISGAFIAYVSAIFHVKIFLQASLLATHQQVLGLISMFQTFWG